MIIQPDYEVEHEPSLIEDVVSPHTEQFTDVNREEVRRRSIGNLHQQYLRSRKKKRMAKLKYAEAAEPEAVEPAKTMPKLRYTRVPPLQTLPSFSDIADAEAATLFTAEELAHNRRSWASQFQDATVDTKDWIVKQMKQKWHLLAVAAAAIFAKIHSAIFGELPKHYSAISGLVVNKRDKVFSIMKVVLPVLLVAFLFAVKGRTTPPTNSHNSGGNTHKSQSNTSAAANSSNSNSQSGSGGAGNIAPVSPITNTPSGGVTAGSSAATSSSPPASSTSTSSPIGGMGGGSAPVPAPTTPQSPTGSVPPSTTVTVPPTNVQAGDKTLLDTNGTSITVN